MDNMDNMNAELDGDQPPPLGALGGLHGLHGLHGDQGVRATVDGSEAPSEALAALSNAATGHRSESMSSLSARRQSTHLGIHCQLGQINCPARQKSNPEQNSNQNPASSGLPPTETVSRHSQPTPAPLTTTDPTQAQTLANTPPASIESTRPLNISATTSSNQTTCTPSPPSASSAGPCMISPATHISAAPTEGSTRSSDKGYSSTVLHDGCTSSCTNETNGNESEENPENADSARSDGVRSDVADAHSDVAGSSARGGGAGARTGR